MNPSTAVANRPLSAQSSVAGTINEKNFATGAPMVPNAIPILNANFPTTPSGTTKPTAVITSDLATKNNTKIGSQIEQANQDLSAHTQAVKNNAVSNNVPQDTQTPDATGKTKETPAPEPTIDEQISDIMKNLGYTQNEEAQLSPEEKQTIVQDKEMMGIDNSQLDSNNPDSIASKVNQMLNGSYPLSVTEQASINSIPATFAAALTEAQRIAKNLVGAGNVIGAKNGLQMYSPKEAISRMNILVDEGTKRIGKINNRIVESQGKLTQAFKDNDFKEATHLYDKISNDLKLRTDEINNINKSLADATKQMHTDAMENAKLQIKTITDSANLTYKEKQDAIDNAFKERQIDETTRHNLATELNQKQLESALQGNLPVVGTDIATGTPNQTDQETFLASLPQAQQPLIKGLANYEVDPSTFSTSARQSQGGLTRAQAISLAKQYDPTFNEAQYSSRKSFLKTWNAGNNPRIPLNTAIKHLGELKKAGDEITQMTSAGGIFSKTYNSVQGWIMDHKNDPRALRFNETAEKVADELAKAYKGGTASASDVGQEKERILLSLTNSKPSKDAVVETATNLIGDLVDTYNQQYQASMGKIPTGTNQVIFSNTADALRTMKKSGLNIDLGRFGVPSETASKIDTALNSGYAAQDIVKYLQTDPEYSDKITQALQIPNIKPEDIVNYLKEQE